MREEKANLTSVSIPDSPHIAGLCYTTRNLGYEIKSIAADRFVGHIERQFDRDPLLTVRFEEPHLLMMNGWYSEDVANCFPPSRMHCTSYYCVHIAGKRKDHLLSPESIGYFRRHVRIHVVYFGNWLYYRISVAGDCEWKIYPVRLHMEKCTDGEVLYEERSNAVVSRWTNYMQDHGTKGFVHLYATPAVLTCILLNRSLLLMYINILLRRLKTN